MKIVLVAVIAVLLIAGIVLVLTTPSTDVAGDDGPRCLDDAFDDADPGYDLIEVCVATGAAVPELTDPPGLTSVDVFEDPVAISFTFGLATTSDTPGAGPYFAAVDRTRPVDLVAGQGRGGADWFGICGVADDWVLSHVSIPDGTVRTVLHGPGTCWPEGPSTLAFSSYDDDGRITIRDEVDSTLTFENTRIHAQSAD